MNSKCSESLSFTSVIGNMSIMLIITNVIIAFIIIMTFIIITNIITNIVVVVNNDFKRSMAD